jgi:hypothetical protein
LKGFRVFSLGNWSGAGGRSGVGGWEKLQMPLLRSLDGGKLALIRGHADSDVVLIRDSQP